MIEQVIFYILAFFIVGFSLLAVTERRIIRASVYLLFVLLGTAGLYLILEYHFLAAAQVAVYAGGIMVLFVFSILLTDHPGAEVKYEKPKRMIISAFAALAGIAICGHIIYYNVSRAYQYIAQGEIDMKDLGMTLMGTGKYQYMLPFEAISLLLLACIIGGILIARKK
ncbi:NADH-quinone oxidoreductase subunit J [Parabacteroides sp. Marseille-P3160]|uniref:NADH-quinone oxidoreductase subunit J family protein n=1 Tax=Parabacteroides sp. Marseille-P3160 TaxID=1917887 RepID=UPI0009BB8BEB|nr:NADH-quinone oxidoreductase subunit J [Parabacteroides sp. Marseille-P3160]